MAERELWIGIRKAVLLLLDVLERYLAISPTTSEIRRRSKN